MVLFCSTLEPQVSSLAFTTYQGGKLFFLGLDRDGKLSVYNRTFSRCMGLSGSSQTLYLSTLYQLWRFENSLAPSEHYQGYDRLYVPQLAYTTVAFCPGYARGLCLRGDFAVLGLSRSRQNRTFSGLALDEKLLAKGAEPRTGLLVIDLRSGDTVHWVRCEGVIEELYDVALLDGAVRPMALGFRTDEIRRLITVGPEVPHHQQPATNR
ncbi:MAG: DUF4915 domain-containing protein [Gammaproteobacteria bacterium]